MHRSRDSRIPLSFVSTYISYLAALATAGDLPLMASAFKNAIEAGRKAYLSGLGRVLTRGASSSDPLTGFLRN